MRDENLCALAVATRKANIEERRREMRDTRQDVMT